MERDLWFFARLPYQLVGEQRELCNRVCCNAICEDAYQVRFDGLPHGRCGAPVLQLEKRHIRRHAQVPPSNEEFPTVGPADEEALHAGSVESRTLTEAPDTVQARPPALLQDARFDASAELADVVLLEGGR